MTSGAWMLTLTWLIPTLTVLITAALPRGRDGAVRWLNLGSTGLNLALVGWLAFTYASNPPAPAAPGLPPLAFAARIPWFSTLNIDYHVGVDGISLAMMLLAGIIAFCGVLVSWTIDSRVKEFFIFMQVLLAGTFGCFVSLDLFTFFLFNEVTLIPTYLLIGVFGSGRKEYAAMKLNLMLIGGSALILTGLLGLYFADGRHTFNLLEFARQAPPVSAQHWIFPLLFLGFGVLGALFPFHTWSPDGHSSAPTAISMFLAGVHMKLGGYGCIRVAMYLLPDGAREWMAVFLILSTINIVYGAFVAVKHTDLKYINAYASVSHCGLVLFGFASLTWLGLRGGVMQMFSHGLLTALFFALIGMIYGRTHTRQVGEMSGLMKTMPFLGVSFTIAALAGLGLPGLSGFIAELNVFLGGFAPATTLNRTCAVLAILSIVIAAVYLLRAINAVLNGPVREEFAKLPDATLREKVVVVLLAGTSLAMGVCPGWVTKLVDGSVQAVLDRMVQP